MFGRCEQCGKTASANAEGRLAPWCSECGGNVAPDTSTAVALDDVVLRWQQSKAPGLELPLPNETLDGAIDRVQREQQREAEARRKTRLASLGTLAAGIVFVAIAVGIVLFQANAAGSRPYIKIPLLAGIVGLSLLGCGVYSLVTGTRTIDLSGEITWDITIDRQGVHRKPAAGTIGLIDGQFHPWDRIAWLEYEEDFTFGSGRSLVLVLGDESRERIGLAVHVSIEDLVGVATAAGKKVEVTSAGDWSRRGSRSL